jgi:hypothetical protein
MDSLDLLLEKRESLRLHEKQLTEQIKLHRKRKAANKTTPTRPEILFKDQIKELQGVIAVLERGNGKTYANIGEMLEVSANRARQIVSKHIRRLRWYSGRLNSELESSLHVSTKEGQIGLHINGEFVGNFKLFNENGFSFVIACSPEKITGEYYMEIGHMLESYNQTYADEQAFIKELESLKSE